MEFVGREHELKVLMQAWTKTKQNDPQLVVLLADSGYGKTRLVHEFYHELSCNEDSTDYWPDYLGSNTLYEGDTSLNVK
jgi:ATP-dependent Clp protease ATP-binding subunit ClpA